MNDGLTDEPSEARVLLPLFTREYKSLFGVPSMRDVQLLREEAQAQASQ